MYNSKPGDPEPEAAERPFDKPVRVAIVEDEHVVREELVTLLRRSPRFTVVGSYANAETALAAIPAAPPDVLLLDLQLPGLSGTDCLQRLRFTLPDLKIVVLTKFEDADHLFNALRAGASGYLLKRFADRDLETGIVAASLGGAPMSPEIARRVIDYFRTLPRRNTDLERLSRRETDVLHWLSQGYSYKQIAQRLGLSLETVNGYIKSIYKKLHVHSSIDAIRVLRGERARP
jgi:DNA-binding NarL/FixJ family response regulator